MYNKFLGLLALLISLQIISFGQANQVNFDELYILDRDKALKELIAGTDSYFHYHCLNAQSKNKRKLFETYMGQWYKKYPHSKLYKEMLNRQALLDYEQNPAKSLAHITKEMQLKFNHQKIAEQRKAHYPNVLDQKVFDWSNFENTHLQYISDAGLELFSKRNMDFMSRRQLLQRVNNASFANLPKLIIDDLNSKNSGGFGSLPIHNLLTRDQLD